ncbi:NAD(+) synthase [Parabacteroides pacaensis]|uniref:NAD(+) synthase n=1 Tax=Parabacteroides pacaensis TaxID=2086575 RepID=UPI000D0F8855|nr:NAD(+) synthase [Parabacteroides pacaensis]
MITNHGFIQVAAAIPEVKVADCSFNIERIEKLMRRAEESGVQIVCFPELSVTGYTCGDLFNQQLLLEEAEKQLGWLREQTASLSLVAIVGMPVVTEGKVFNAAIVVQQGEILGVIPKTHLPNYSEFYEKRWFAGASEVNSDTIRINGEEVPFGTDLVFESPATLHPVIFGVEICEDLWTPIPPSCLQAMQGAQLIFNLSASDEVIGKHDYLVGLIKQQSARCIAGYIYVSAGFGESTTDLVFAGNGIIAENGTILAKGERFSLQEQLIISQIDIDRLNADRRRISSFTEFNTANRIFPYRKVLFDLPGVDGELTRKINPYPFVPADKDMDARCEEIFAIQVNGLAKRILHTHSRHLVVGISGGLDSTLALLVCVKTCDKLGIPREQIIGITMPGFGTTDRTYQNALALMHSLGVTVKEISIRAACEQHFRDIGHSPEVHDVTYENSQARERTQILMDVANQVGGLVIGTGDLSELALGWATYNGDQMSMYGVNAGIPKTLVRYLVRWVAATQVDKDSAATLKDILATPVSPELLPAGKDGTIAQKTEDIVGPYELHDFFLYYMIRFGFRPSKIYYLAQQAFAGIYPDEEIKKWLNTFLHRFFTQQFKRSCMPDGPKVGSINLSPRGDWRMPSDATATAWLKEAADL